MSEKYLDPSAFEHFKEIPCDKCGTVSSYSPETIADVKECFGCLCKRLDENDVHCPCGWKGRWFKDVKHDENLQALCPKCDAKLDKETAR